MNMTSFILRCRELLYDPNGDIYTDDEILLACEDGLRKYSDDTGAFLGEFIILEQYCIEEKEPNIKLIYWGMNRNITYNGILSRYQPQPKTLPMGNGYPPPLKRMDIIPFGWDNLFTPQRCYQYPDDFLQYHSGVTPDGFGILASSYRKSEQKKDINDYPRKIWDDNSSDGFFKISPQKNFYAGERINDETSGFGIVDDISGVILNDGYGIISGGIGLIVCGQIVEEQGIIRYCRVAKSIEEIKDYMAIIFYAAYRLFQTRNESESQDRSEFFRILYRSRIGNFQSFKKYMTGYRRSGCSTF